MSELLNKQIVLKLNKLWQPVAFMTVRDAVVFLCSESSGEKPGFAMDYEMVTNDSGDKVLAYTNLLSWDEWVNCPIRDEDLAINTTRGPIRVPLVVVCASYAKLPIKTPRASAGTIYQRDNGVCQYSGKKLPRTQLNLDHVIPRSRGGKDVFENLVLADKAINTLKGNRTPEEAGLKLIRKPRALPTMPVVFTVEDAKHESQRPFLI